MSERTNTGLYFGIAAAGAAALIFSSGSKTDYIHPVSQDDGTPSKFIAKYLLDAQEAARRTNVPAIVTLSQAGLESNWGKNAYGNNFFGIKAGKSWTGATQFIKSWECGKTGNPAKDGITEQVLQILAPGATGNPCGTKYYAYRVLAKFRRYLSARDGFIDHAIFLVMNPRYKKAFYYSQPPPFAWEVAQAGYATDPNYGNKLVHVVNQVQKLT